MAEAWTKWRGLVFEQRAWQFYEWKKRLGDSETARFVEAQIAAPLEPMRPAVARSSAIEIRLSEGCSLVVEPGFEASHLRALLVVLESPSVRDARPEHPELVRQARERAQQRHAVFCDDAVGQLRQAESSLNLTCPS